MRVSPAHCPETNEPVAPRSDTWINMSPSLIHISLRAVFIVSVLAVITTVGRADAVISIPDTPDTSGSALASGASNDRLLRAFVASMAKKIDFEHSIPLTDFPTWGKTVEGASGVLDYRGHFPGGFVGHVALSGLAPKHIYILTLNGNPERAGNDKLKSPVPGNEKERYYDFQIIMTDGAGTFSATYGIALAAGNYDVRFYVKDTADFKIVLYHDFVPFTVE